MTRNEVLGAISGIRRVMSGAFISKSFQRNVVEEETLRLYQTGGPDGGYLPRMDIGELWAAIQNPENSDEEITERIVSRWEAQHG